MLSREENERLTRVGKGAPMGELMRRYWIPVAFQKKSKKGIATPKRDIDLIRERLKRAEEHYRTQYPTGAWL